MDDARLVTCARDVVAGFVAGASTSFDADRFGRILVLSLDGPAERRSPERIDALADEVVRELARSGIVGIVLPSRQDGSTLRIAIHSLADEVQEASAPSTAAGLLHRGPAEDAPPIVGTAGKRHAAFLDALQRRYRFWFGWGAPAS